MVANPIPAPAKTMRNRVITVKDKIQQGYRYILSEPSGRNFDPDFVPDLTPQEMLRLGVFGGKYITDSVESSQAAGSSAQSFLPKDATTASTISAYTPASRCRSGAKGVGSGEIKRPEILQSRTHRERPEQSGGR